MTSTAATTVHTDRLLTDTRVRVRCRTTRCFCGCGGRDPQHREEVSRTLREVRKLGTPRPYLRRVGGREAEPCSVRHVVAVADVLAPWGEVVHAQAVAYVDGTFASWELVTLAR